VLLSGILVVAVLTYIRFSLVVDTTHQSAKALLLTIVNNKKITQRIVASLET
jgi:hypothetical protein